eukprot:COSAG03_NODE_6002_length_1133_cov_1.354932_3_plen_44_part_01
MVSLLGKPSTVRHEDFSVLYAELREREGNLRHTHTRARAHIHTR